MSKTQLDFEKESTRLWSRINLILEQD